jgi:hypothetical protein
MSKTKLWASLTLAVAVLAATFGLAPLRSQAADHLDAPTAKKDGRVDINDVYLFHPGAPGHQDLGRTVMVMTVNPAAGVISGTTFRAGAVYELNLDQTGDARADIVITARFSGPDASGRQIVTVRWRSKYHNHLVARGYTDTVIEGRGTGEGATVFAGLRDDPFFFDLAAFNAGAQFCQPGFGTDFFLGLNTSAIVIEIPTWWLNGENHVGLWGRTEAAGRTVDRMGRPAILTVFIPPNPFEAGSTAEGNLEDQFNFTRPQNDQAMWRSEVVNSLTLLFSLNDGSGDDPSDDAATIQAIADILLPDLLTADLSQETGFLNGRNLADDVIDAELGLITEGLITTDCVANDSTFLPAFPYLGMPNH